MNAVLYPLCAGIAWIGLLFKLPVLTKGRRQPASVAIAAFYLFMGLTFTISDPRVWAVIDRATGVPNLSLLLSQGSVIGVAASQLAALTWWAYLKEAARPKVRLRSLLFLGVFVVMAVLFTLAELTEEDTTTAAVRYAGHGLYTVYLMLYVTAFAIAEYAVVVHCLRHARTIDVPWLRRGLRLAVAGGIGGLIYVAARYADVVAAPLGLDPARWEFVARLGAGLGGILTLIGWSLPGWGPQFGALRGWLRRQRSYRRLHPLWSALYRANPDIALDRPSPWKTVRDLDFALHRRVVEIRDGQRWLRPYLDQDLTLSGDAVQVEAAQFVAALAVFEEVGAPPSSVRTSPASGTGGLDQAEEVAWLVRVADEFTRIKDRT